MKPEQHTPKGASLRPPLSLVAWLLIAVAAPALAVWFSGRDAAPGEEPAQNQLQHSGLAGAGGPEQALAEYRASMRAWLDTYDWIDREGGIARVPIEEGMRAVLSEGLPAREAVEEEGQ